MGVCGAGGCRPWAVEGQHAREEGSAMLSHGIPSSKRSEAATRAVAARGDVKRPRGGVVADGRAAARRGGHDVKSTGRRRLER